MIDFRYHIVSIIAVFFALATGIVLGAGPLGDKADENLGDQLAAFREDNNALRGERNEVQGDFDLQSQYLGELAPRAVSGELVSRHVAVIALPGAEDDDVETVQEMLDNAGAVTDLRVRVESAWAEPDANATLDDLADAHVSSDAELDPDADGYTRGATVLASALMAKIDETTGGEPSLEPLNTDTLEAYEADELITVEEESTSRATLAVVVAGGLSGPDAEDLVANLEPLAEELDAVGEGVVVAGPATTAEEGGLIARIRDGDASDIVSTVDSLPETSAQIGTVYALAEQAAGGVGQYGVMGETDGQVPPAPEIDEPPGDETSGDDGSASDDNSGSDET